MMNKFGAAAILVGLGLILRTVYHLGIADIAMIFSVMAYLEAVPAGGRNDTQK